MDGRGLCGKVKPLSNDVTIFLSISGLPYPPTKNGMGIGLFWHALVINSVLLI